MLTGAGTVPVRVDGLPVPKWFQVSTSQALKEMKLRPTDIVLASWPKSGTHWIFRALRLLTMGAAFPESGMTLAEMLPATRPESALPPTPWNPTGLDSFDALLEREPAVRIIVSHAPPSMLPPLDAAGGGKLVYVCRDPKDVITSNYFFMGTPKDGWDGSMNRFLAPAHETPNAFGGWFEHVQQFEQLVTRLGPERACLIEYEDMHADLRGCLKRLAALLGPEAEATLAREGDAIERALSFNQMKADGANPHIMRKGEAGGWKEHFRDGDAPRLEAALLQRLPRTTESIAGHGRWRPIPSSASTDISDPGTSAAECPPASQTTPVTPAFDPTEGINLRPYGRKRFRKVDPKVFVTSAGVRIVYQLAVGTKAPLVIIGGGQSGRAEACEQFSAESDDWSQHTVLIIDRRNTGASDVMYDGATAENELQRDDIIELLSALKLGPAILIGFSSGARLLALVAEAKPELVRALALLILTGGPLAASQLGQAYYLQYVAVARAGGMQAVLRTPFYAERAAMNAKVREALLAMAPSEFIASMEASAALYAKTQDEPALALPAAKLKQLAMPVFVCNFFGEGHSDGMHTAAVTRAVAASVPGSHVVVSTNLREWWGALTKFVGEHST